MSVYGVITAAILRKLSALIGEIRGLVAAATKVEKEITSKAKADVETILANAKVETKKLENDLINQIAKL